MEHSSGSKALPPVGVAVLALLAERPMHPYEMLQTLRDRMEDIAMPVSIGSLYHAVSRLADHGLVRPVRAEQVGNRPERTTYEILDAGRDAMGTRVRELLSVATEPGSADHVGIGELHNLTPAEALQAVDTRLADLDAQLVANETLLAEAAQGRNVHEIYLLYGSYRTAQQRHEREWFATLRDRIQTGDLTWPTQS